MKRKVALIMIVMLLGIITGCGDVEQKTQVESDSGYVQDRSISLSASLLGENLQMDGLYTGEFVEKKPHGQGKFVAENVEESASYVYEGSFANGLFNGYGVTNIVIGDESITLGGTYSKGAFTPTVGETFNCLGQLDLFGKFSIPNEITTYIDENTELFSTSTKELLSTVDIKAFSNKQFSKTRKQEEIGIVELDLLAVQVFEDDFFDKKVTYLLAVDDEFNYYAVYYLNTAEIYDEDTFTVYSVPCGTTFFENIGGGITNVTVLAACYIE